MKRLPLLFTILLGLSSIALSQNNVIYYTSTDGKVVKPNRTDCFGATIVSNTYKNGKGVITFDNNVTKIGDGAFCEYYSLESITIPEGVTEIGEGAFEGCSSLTSITIPESVTEIGEWAFSECESLTSITIPEGVTEIGEEAFAGCESLAKFNGKLASEDGRFLIINGVLKAFAPAGLTEYSIPAGVTKIGEGAFAGCESLTSITIPESVTEIGEWAFLVCESLESITIPDGVTEIGESAFRGCSSLTSITIPKSVTEIGKGAFYECESLESITIPNSVTKIGDFAFSGCESLRSVYCKPTIPPVVGCYMLYYTACDPIFYVPRGSVQAYKRDWSGYADAIVGYDFPATTAVTTAKTTTSISSIPKNQIWYTSTYGEVVRPNEEAGFGATIISNTYTNGKGVITFDNDITKIGDKAFYYCESLTSITIPDSVIKIGEEAFSGCKSLTSITIPNGVNKIGEGAFEGCSSLRSITIPESVTSIGFGAFQHCYSLRSVYCKPTIPPVVGGHMFFDNASDLIIYVPRGSVQAYKRDWRDWSDYTDAIVGFDF